MTQLSNPMRKFLSDPEMLNLIDNNDFVQLYMNSNAYGVLMNSELTRVLLAAEIDPLKFMQDVPRGFMHEYRDGHVVSLPDHIKSIKERAFQGSTINTINLPASLEDIHNQSFEYCSQLTSVDFPSSVAFLGPRAFAHCTSLTNISFPDDSKLETISEHCFSGCVDLGNVILPKSVKHIGVYAFSKTGFHGKSLTILSPDCEINDNFLPPYRNLLIKCYKGSTADKWATENNVHIVYLD